eukprot:CAMPEP_0178438118 /NCGR_PEP_ID=MMETSP0689_2-20121128/35395_1 /TAXON_ID=160604 /ORGANISM="Amphidinium massartii, Strain CS-259" /LENGTH=133 /DNA_ID=CAMNT_0020060445 /DNA_START=8 /DNA_END=409 /DNA_ORIENTATION=-
MAQVAESGGQQREIAAGLARNVKIDEKVWFSVERTFLHWARLAAILATSAIALATRSESIETGIAAAVVALVGAVVLFWSMRRHQQRLKGLTDGKVQNIEDYSDRKGAVFLAASMTLALLAVVICTAVELRVD